MDKIYRVNYSFKGQQFNHRVSVRSKPADLELELRKAAAYTRTSLYSQFHDVVLTGYEEVAL